MELYLGKVGLSSKTLFRNQATRGCVLKVMLLGRTKTDGADRAVFIVLPKPEANKVARKSFPFSALAFNRLIPFDWQNRACTARGHCNVFGPHGNVVTSKGLPDKRQTRRERFLFNGWVTLCLLGRCKSNLLGLRGTYLQVPIFIARGNHACKGQCGNVHTPVALSSFIFLKAAANTLKGGKG